MTNANAGEPPNPDNGSRWLALSLATLLILLLIRILYTAFVPLDLIHDEAYYWDWSRRLDWGYYSKPPMVAWLIALASWTGSDEFNVRLPAVLLGTGSLGFIYLLAASMYNRRAGFLAMILAAATPGNTALSLIMTIDAPLIFFWTASLFFVWKYVAEEKANPFWLLLFSLAAGLGLLSKQTMIAVFPLTLFYLALFDRKRLPDWKLGLAFLAAMAFLTPVLVWNSQHEWITFQHTREHFAHAEIGILKRLTFAGEFILGEFGVCSPVTFWLAASVIFGFLIGKHIATVPDKFLLTYCVLPLTGVLALSLTQRVELNWPAPFLIPGIVLLAGHLTRERPAKSTSWLNPQAKTALLVGIGSVALTTLMPFEFGHQGSRFDFAARLRGWEKLANQIDKSLKSIPEHRQLPLIVTAGRGLTAELAFYLDGQPNVFCWNSSGKIISQYDLWKGPDFRNIEKAVLITGPVDTIPSDLADRFHSIKSLTNAEVKIGTRLQRSCRIWIVSKPRRQIPDSIPANSREN